MSEVRKNSSRILFTCARKPASLVATGGLRYPDFFPGRMVILPAQTVRPEQQIVIKRAKEVT